MFAFIGHLLPILAAGFMNGSFVMPAKYIQRLNAEQIWFYHSWMGLAILPSLIAVCLDLNVFTLYTQLPGYLGCLLLWGGFTFGLGQLFFVYAIEKIGIALSFTINLAVGMTLGSLFVVFYSSAGVHAGALVSLAVGLILVSLVLYYDAAQPTTVAKPLPASYRWGWWLAILTGLTSGLQNIVFVIVAFHSPLTLQTTPTFWVWVPFLLAAALPMTVGFYARIQRSRSLLSAYPLQLTPHTLGLITLMGFLFTGSLALYSYGMNQLLPGQRVVGWPVFMVVIILTAHGFYEKPISINRLSEALRRWLPTWVKSDEPWNTQT